MTRRAQIPFIDKRPRALDHLKTYGKNWICRCRQDGREHGATPEGQGFTVAAVYDVNQPAAQDAGPGTWRAPCADLKDCHQVVYRRHHHRRD
jgi:hypothetical protein